MALGLNYYLDEAKYHVHKTKRMLQGKAVHIGMRTAMGGGAASVASDLSYPVRDAINIAQPTVAGAATAQTAMSAGEIILSSTGGLVSIGLGAGVNGYLNHLEHKHHKRQLTDLYRPQIASLTGKEPDAVGVPDLQAVAADNPSLKNELKRNDNNRRVKNVASVVGTAFAFAAVFAAITFVPPLAGLAAAAATTGLLSGAGLGFAAAAGGIGYASLQFARKGLTSIGNKLTGLDEPSVEDKLRVMSKQHRKEQNIVPEQVMDVYVAANPALASEIESQHGKSFSHLPIPQKRAVTAQYAEALQTPQIAAAINDGHMNVRELTFRVHGQTSGVYPEEPWQDRFKEMAAEHLDPLQEKIEHMRADAVGKFQHWRENREQSKLQDDIAKAIEEGKPLPKKAEEVGNETYWRNMIANQRAEKSSDGPARA